MNRVLTLTASIEAATGLALMVVPAVVVRLLLGGEISGVAIPLGRVAGFGLLALGMASWPGRHPAGNLAPALRAMLTYNALAALYLLCLGLRGQWVGPLLWPAVAMHAILSLLLARQWRQ
ncbi:MAG: hypothetical protein ACLP2P_05585 [Desulfobaccales bacterium]